MFCSRSVLEVLEVTLQVSPFNGRSALFQILEDIR